MNYAVEVLQEELFGLTENMMLCQVKDVVDGIIYVNYNGVTVFGSSIVPVNSGDYVLSFGTSDVPVQASHYNAGLLENGKNNIDISHVISDEQVEKIMQIKMAIEVLQHTKIYSFPEKSI